MSGNALPQILFAVILLKEIWQVLMSDRKSTPSVSVYRKIIQYLYLNE